MTIALLAPLAYLLGTFPSALLVGRAFGHDVYREGSGNPGASNVMRLAGVKAGLLVLVADFAKGAIAAGVGLAVGGRPGAFVLGFVAVVGHTFPFGRKGGKGVATAGGALVVLYPLIVLGLGALWFVLARVVKKASVGSLAVAVAFPVLAGVTGSDGWEVALLAVLAGLIVVRHLGNVRRLVRGEERGLF